MAGCECEDEVTVENKIPFQEAIDYAAKVAFKAHGDQLYGKGPLPHTYHLRQVYETVLKHYPRLFSDEGVIMLQGAWLHDTLEDTDLTFDELFSMFGRQTARLVEAVTNIEEDHFGRKLKRWEKSYYTYPKIRCGGRRAVGLKLADRIANVRHCIDHNHSMLMMYQREYENFREYLQIPGELKPMWQELDVLMSHQVEVITK